MKQYQISLIHLNVGDQLFSIFSKLLRHNLQQLSQAITQRGRITSRALLEFAPSNRSQNRLE